MTNWREYFNRLAAGAPEGEYLKQVGKTVNGEPVSEANVAAMVGDIVRNLNMNQADRVLDLCCGNGILTRRCAHYCDSIVGVDFSPPLIQVANQHFSGANIEYKVGDVARLSTSLQQTPFTKVYMYEALQHISSADTESLLTTLRESAAGQAWVYLAGIPDKDRIWNFYNTPQRREEYHRRIQAGTEAIGHWWRQLELSALGERCGYRANFPKPNPVLHGVHYRFDVLFTPQ